MPQCRPGQVQRCFGPLRATDFDLATSGDVSEADWQYCVPRGGGPDRSAQTACLVTSVTFFRTATGELSERFLDRGDQTPAPPMASVCFGNTPAGRKSARRL
jgi:hypothetical protein